MWSATERDVLQMELRVDYRSRRRGVPDAGLPEPDFAGCARDLVGMDDKFLRSYQGGNVFVYLADKEIHQVGGDLFLTLLLAISDKRRPNNVLSNPEADHRREIEKDEGEGNDHSCHIVISLTPTLQGGHCYRAAFEQVPLFSPQYVHRFVRHIFKEVTMKHPRTVPHGAGVRQGGEFEEVPVSLKTEFRAVPSSELLRDLQQGVLSGIELSREEQGRPRFDEKAFTVDKRSTLMLEPTDRRNPPPIMDVIKSVCAKADEKHFTSAKVIWKVNGRPQTAKFDCDTASIAENRYIKRHTITLQAPLPASCDKIDAHLARSMMSWIS